MAVRRCRPHSIETVGRQYTHQDYGRYVRANTTAISNVLARSRPPARPSGQAGCPGPSAAVGLARLTCASRTSRTIS